MSRPPIDKDISVSRRGLLRSVMLLGVSAVIIFVSAASLSVWVGYMSFNDIFGKQLRIERASDRISGMDEVLTMSAKMAAATGDLSWKARYINAKGDLDAAIREIEGLLQDSYKQFAEKISLANDRLVELETRSFDLVEEGRAEEAAALLSCSEYEQYKREYRVALAQLYISVQEELSAALRNSDYGTVASTVLSIVAALLLVSAWVQLTRIVHKPLRALQESEAKFRDLADMLPQMVFEADTEGNVAYVNSNALVVLGYSEADVDAGLKLQQIIAPADRIRAGEVVKKVLDGSLCGKGLEFTALKKDGCEFPAVIYLTRFFHDDKVAGVRGTMVDFTDHKQVEETLRIAASRKEREASAALKIAMSPFVSEGQLPQLVAMLVETGAEALEVERVGVWLFDETQTILSNMDTYIASTGQHVSGDVLNEKDFEPEFTALKSARFVDGHDVMSDPRLAGYVEGYLKPNRITSMLDVSILLEGQHMGALCFEHVDRPHCWSEDEINFACQLADQIALTILHSRQRKSESEKVTLEAQLVQSQKMESVGRLAGGVAHDFNNMLGVIIAHADMLLNDLHEGTQIYDDVKEIKKAADRSADLTRQLLAFARKQTVTPVGMVLNEAVENMTKMLCRLIGENIELDWRPQAGLWNVYMDPGQVNQILVNLCVNSRDAIKGSGKIEIQTANEELSAVNAPWVEDGAYGEYVRMSVIDNGAGMDRETLRHIFEPFFTTKERGEGTGLGLATIYGMVKQNHGMIRVFSEPGRGSAFHVYLPRYKAVKDKKAEAVEQLEKEHGTESILLVEDEVGILKITRRMLEKQGYSVIAVNTPAQALEAALKHHGDLDLLISDVVMPEMNGRDLAARVMSLHPGIRCLFISGYTADVIACHGVVYEGTSFLQKPFSRNQLLNKVRGVLDNKG